MGVHYTKGLPFENENLTKLKGFSWKKRSVEAQ